MTIYAVVNNQIACWPEHPRYKEVIQMVKNGKKGFDPNSHEHNGSYARMNAFLMAAYRGCGIELFKAMLEKVDVNEETGDKSENYTALMWACRRPKHSSNIKYIKNALDMVEILLQHEDIIINHPDMDGNRAIMHTIMTFGSASRKEANDKILEQRNIGVKIMNAFFNHRDNASLYYGMNKQNQDLLHIAALHGCEPETFDTIYTKVTSLPDEYGNNALMHLVTAKWTERVTDPWPNVDYMMKKLVITIDPNRKNKKGKTALIIAVEEKNTKMVELLLKYTTDIDPTIQYNKKTALQIAMSNEQDDIVKIISDYQTKLACQCSDLQACAMPRFKF